MSEFRLTLLQAFESVLEDRSAIYLAGPLATGKRFFEASADAHFSPQTLRQENARAMRAVAKSLRTTQEKPVIDPSLLQPAGWSSLEIGQFYIDLLARFACEVRFMDNWEFSRGATKEFMVANDIGIPCQDIAGRSISLADGINVIALASKKILQLGSDNTPWVARLETLEKIALSRKP
jgi:hypothetical protein